LYIDSANELAEEIGKVGWSTA